MLPLRLDAARLAAWPPDPHAAPGIRGHEGPFHVLAAGEASLASTFTSTSVAAAVRSSTALL